MSIGTVIELLQIAAIAAIAWPLAKGRDAHGFIALVFLLFAVLLLVIGNAWH
jgi:hypothetical protein